jgi:hypothetical protein
VETLTQPDITANGTDIPNGTDVPNGGEIPNYSDIRRNKDLVRALTERGFNDGDLTGIAGYFTADYRVHAPGVPPLPPGPGAFVRAVTLFRTGMPDIHVTVEDLAGDGDRVFGRFTTRGTHTGPLLGIAPSGRPVTIYEWVCHRFVNGRVAESWIGDNLPRILLSIGAAVPVGAAAAVIAGGPPAGPPAGAGPGGPPAGVGVPAAGGSAGPGGREHRESAGT